MPEQPYPQLQPSVEPSWETVENNARNNGAVTSMESGIARAPPTTPTLATKPKRIIKPSLKVKENLGFA